jgi:HEAT repeat protein
MEDEMASKLNRQVPQTVRDVIQLLFCSALLAGVAFSQPEKNPPQTLHFPLDKARVASALAKVSQGKFDLMDVEIIAEAGERAAVPQLKEQFIKSEDRNKKIKIAAALDRLGVKDDLYWDFMVQQVGPVVDSPDPRAYDAQGKWVRDQLSPEFLKWTKDHNLPPDAVYQLPAIIMLFGETGDSRGIPLLRRGLLSRNYFIQAFAARGLAIAQDKDSIPLIIQACEHSPEEGVPIIASYLLYFDDSRAVAAYDKYEPQEFAKLFRDAKAMGEKF